MSKDKIITDLLHNTKGGQMTEEEYSYIYDTISSFDTPNVLVFGTGHDSKLWIHANPNGKTVFLEHNQEWINFAKTDTPELNILKVEYNTHHSEFLKVYQEYKRGSRDLVLSLPDEIINESWDVIIVDSPVGFINGRMQSIATSAWLHTRSKSETIVFVHDCDRIIEMLYCDLFLLPLTENENFKEHLDLNNNFKKLNEYKLTRINRNK